MKKLIVLLFALLLLTGCGCAEETPSEATEAETDKPVLGVLLEDTYDENDLKIEEAVETYNDVEMKIPQIKGLKDTSVEGKINEDFYSFVTEHAKEYDTLDYFNYYVRANFGNVLSIGLNFGGGNKYENFYFNYNLTDGSTLKVEDLFTDDTNLIDMVRNAFYFSMALYGEYDPDTYVVSPDENMIFSAVREYMAGDKEFYFSPSSVTLCGSEYYATLYFTDIADSIAIFDRFLTDEAIFTGDYPGRENIIMYSDSSQYTIFDRLEYDYAAKNMWYDFSTGSYYVYDEASIGEENLEKLNALQEKVFDEFYENIAKYKEIALENPDKFYILLLKPGCQTYSDSEYSNGNWTYYQSNAADISCTIQLFEMPFEVYEDVYIDKLLDAYRYRYFAMAGGIWLDSYELEDGVTCTQLNDKRLYNYHTGERITSLEDLFHPDSDYMSVIEERVAQELSYSHSYDEIPALMEEMVVEINGVDLMVTIPSDEEFQYYIYLSSFEMDDMKIFD